MNHIKIYYLSNAFVTGFKSKHYPVESKVINIKSKSGKKWEVLEINI